MKKEKINLPIFNFHDFGPKDFNAGECVRIYLVYDSNTNMHLREGIVVDPNVFKAYFEKHDKALLLSVNKLETIEVYKRDVRKKNLTKPLKISYLYENIKHVQKLMDGEWKFYPDPLQI
jgi:hypothetical protein